MIANPISGMFRYIFFLIDSLIYSLVPSVYALLNNVANITGFIENDQAIIATVSKSIYSLLAVIMLFRVAFSLLTMIADPDKIEDREKGLSKIVTSVIGCVVLIIVVPITFRVAGEIQQKIFSEKIIESIILSENYCETENFSLDNETTCKPRNTGTYLSYSVFSLFLNIDEQRATRGTNDKIYTAYETAIINPPPVTEEAGFKEQYNQLNSLGEYINEKDKSNRYILNYTIIISTVMGIYLLWIMVTFVIDVAYRSLKLFLLQLVAPVAIVSFVDPSSASKGTFKKWMEESIKTYLSVFIKIASLAFVSLILYNIELKGKSFFVKIFFFLAILTLIKTLPKLLENIFGIKPKSKEESFGQSLLRGALGGIAASTYGGITGGISAKKHGSSFLGGMAIGASSGFAGGAKAAYDGSFSGFYKSFGNSSATVAKTYGFKTGADLRKEKMKYNAEKKYAQSIFDKYNSAYGKVTNTDGAVDLLNGYRRNYGISPSRRDEGSMRKAYGEKEALLSILGKDAAINRGDQGILSQDVGFLKKNLSRLDREIAATSDPIRKAELSERAVRMSEEIFAKERRISKLDSEWKEKFVNNPAYYKDIQIYNALERAKSDRENILENVEICALIDSVEAPETAVVSEPEEMQNTIEYDNEIDEMTEFTIRSQKEKEAKEWARINAEDIEEMNKFTMNSKKTNEEQQTTEADEFEIIDDINVGY